MNKDAQEPPPAWAVRLYENTLEQLGLLRAETAAGFRALSAEMNGRFDMVDKRFDMVEAELRALGAAERDNARDVLGLQKKAGA